MTFANLFDMYETVCADRREKITKVGISRQLTDIGIVGKQVKRKQYGKSSVCYIRYTYE